MGSEIISLVERPKGYLALFGIAVVVFAILRYSRSPLDGKFPRVQRNPLSWRPVHEIVQEGYSKVIVLRGDAMIRLSDSHCRSRSH